MEASERCLQNKRCGTVPQVVKPGDTEELCPVQETARQRWPAWDSSLGPFVVLDATEKAVRIEQNRVWRNVGESLGFQVVFWFHQRMLLCLEIIFRAKGPQVGSLLSDRSVKESAF